jgi:DNA-binding beta-propeller fold protein YncE
VRFTGFIDLPEHTAQGGFDHAAVHTGLSRVYVAHTSNDAIDVIDCAADRYLFSVPHLTGVAGALVSDERGLVFTSNRGEDSIGVFAVGDEQNVNKIPVGRWPNGLAFDARRGRLLAANVGDPAVAGSFTLSIVDIKQRELIHSIGVSGRTRWTVFDPEMDSFYVNIADPAEIAVVEAAKSDRVARSFPIPAAGPHGLDLDGTNRRLFCACDAGILYSIGLPTGRILGEARLSGTPDVIFFNPGLLRLYVAVGDPGVIDVFDTRDLRRVETVVTGKGAHTIAFEPTRNRVYAFLPATHRAAVYSDGAEE